MAVHIVKSSQLNLMPRHLEADRLGRELLICQGKLSVDLPFYKGGTVHVLRCDCDLLAAFVFSGTGTVLHSQRVGLVCQEISQHRNGHRGACQALQNYLFLI